MKRIIFILIIFSSTALLAGAQPANAEASWSIRTGVNLYPGLFYNRGWEPGYSGSAAFVTAARTSGPLMFEAGAEAGYSFTGFNLLFPLRAGYDLLNSGIFSLAAEAAVLPGMILSRPSPYFLFAVEAGAKIGWRISEGFNLSLYLGPRYSFSPGYSSTVSRLETIDLNIACGAGFNLK